jgi:RimJ/RimL family protein N-acetyltransferase
VKWPVIQALSALAPLPPGYRYGRLDRVHVASLIAALREWHPDLAVGAMSCYLREDFYLERVGLDGDLDKDVYAARILFDDEMVGFWSFEREEDSLAIYGRLIALAPAHRGTKLSVHALSGTESIGRTMGAAFMYALVTLKNPYAQQALERAGYRLLGFFPGRDREEVSPGVVKRVYQAVYAKLLVPPDQVHWPDPKNMTPRARSVYQLLFSEAAEGRPG